MAAATTLGWTIVLLDIVVFRPLCPPVKGDTGCFSVGGDALGVFLMARLLAWGKGLINPITYELAGGYEIPFIGKPPALVSYLGGVLWLAERPFLVRALVVAVIAVSVVLLLRNRWAHPKRRVAEVAIAVLAVVSVLADNPVLLARVATSAVALTAIPVVALVARRLVDETTGVVTAILMALTPSIWIGASMMNVETLYVVALPLVLLATLRAADSPGAARYAQLGVALLLLSFTRLEGVALVPLLVGGLILTNRRAIRNRATATGHVITQPGAPGLGRRLGLAALALVIVAVPLAGWSALNASRLGKNVGVSAGGGGVLWSGACDEVAFGRFKGFWTLCTPETVISERVPLTEAVDDLVAVPGYAEVVLEPDNEMLSRAMVPSPRTASTPLASLELARSDYVQLSGTLPNGQPGVGIWVDDRPVDDADLMLEPGQLLRVHPNPVSGFSEVELDAGGTARAMRYYGDHLKDLPLLGAARVGRAFGVFRPAQTVQLETLVEGRESWQAWGAMAVWWVSAPLALMGVVRLRGRRPVWPFAVVAVLVVSVVAASLGIPRFRLGLDLVVCVLAAVPLAGWLDRRWPSTARRMGLADGTPLAGTPVAVGPVEGDDNVEDGEASRGVGPPVHGLAT